MNRFSGPILAILAFAGVASSAHADDACPSEAEVQAALTHYITEDFWSPGERQIWKITDVSGFAFGQVKIAAPQSGRCAVRVEYSFKVTHADGRVDDTKKGVGETFYFFRDDFGDWNFRVG